MKKASTYCWRHCRRKATDMDFAPEFPFCAFHADCGLMMFILNELGAPVAPDTAPFLLPCLIVRRMVGEGELYVGRDEDDRFTFGIETKRHVPERT